MLISSDIEGVLFLYNPPSACAQSQRRRPSLITPQSRSRRRPPHGSRAHVDSRRVHVVESDVDVAFEQISLFELQRRRVITRQCAFGKRTRKKTKLGERRGFVRISILRFSSFFFFLASVYFTRMAR